MRKYIVYQMVLIIIYFALIILFSYMSLQKGGESSNLSSRVANDIADVQETITKKQVVVDDSYIKNVRKIIGHFGFFMMFGFVSALLYLSFYTLKVFYRVSIHFVSSILFALISEFLLEANTLGRTASFKDVLIDTSGFVLASLIIFVIYFIYTKRKPKELE